MECYRIYVKGILRSTYAAKWKAGVQMHSMHPPYAGFVVLPGEVVGFIRSLDLDCGKDLSVRHWCRLRCGLPLLMHLGGRASGARHQDCIFCGQCTAKPLIHCIAICPHWHKQRLAFSASVGMVPMHSNLDFTVKWLSIGLNRSTLGIVVGWAADIDRGAHNFWKSR